MRLRVCVADDERPSIVRLQQLLEVYPNVEVVGTFTRIPELLDAFPKLMPDVLFLDIEMPDTNGLELAGLLRDVHQDVDIVFVTAFEQYALEAYRVRAADYLLKPVEPWLLDRCLQWLCANRARV